MIKEMDNTQTYIELSSVGDKEYSTYCVHGFNPKENCNRCCKYCGIPFIGFECPQCGYDVEWLLIKIVRNSTNIVFIVGLIRDLMKMDKSSDICDECKLERLWCLKCESFHHKDCFDLEHDD